MVQSELISNKKQVIAKVNWQVEDYEAINKAKKQKNAHFNEESDNVQKTKWKLGQP